MTGLRLELRSITVAFGGVTALDDFNLAAAPGEIVGVIGPNGAGKTTLFNCIGGTVLPARGSILIDGAPIDGLPSYRRARIGISRTFQTLALLDSLSVRDNVRLAAEQSGGMKSTEAAAEAGRLLKLFGLASIGPGPVQGLPVGIRRKIDLARAIVARPRLLLLDEPTSGLSEIETAEVIAILRSQHAALGFTALLVEHQMPVVMALADRIAALDFGRKIAEGTPEAIRANPAVLASYLGGST